MCSARDFFPRIIRWLMKRATLTSPKRLSGVTGRLGACPLLDISGGLGRLGAVLGALLLAVADAGGVQLAADDVVAHAGEVADATAADQDDGVFLEGVALAGDVGGDLHAVGEPHPGHLAEGRVGLLRAHRLDLDADALLLGGGLLAGRPPPQGVEAEVEGRRLDLLPRPLPALPDQLVDGWHATGDLVRRPTAYTTHAVACQRL